MIEASDRLRTWRDYPVQMVRDLFGVDPDPWQADVLEAFPHNQRIAMQACKGPGKSCVLAWVAWNFLLTRPHPRCAATSISGDNLRDGFWAEMAKWQNRDRTGILDAAFTWTKQRIFAKDSPETWWMAARNWRQDADKTQQANTLAGIHEDFVLFILDESGSMADAVMAAAEAALSSCKEGHIVQAGNPTALEGPLYRAATSEKHLWFRVEITGDPDDPNRSPRISPQWAREQMEKWGRDHPYVLVNVFGRFPPASFNALIGADEVDAAMKRYYREHEIGAMARIIGVDVALFGDDASSIARRQGIQMFPFTTHRNVDPDRGAGIVNRIWNEWGADAAFIDATGGFGSGWISHLRQLGQSPIGVQFAGKPHDPAAYSNKRAEMYFDFVRWIKDGGALPESKGLKDALIATTYTAPKGLLILEPKEFIKAKIGHSPDEADAGAMTFAEPVSAKTSHRPIMRQPERYEPFREIERAVTQAYAGGDYNPYRDN